MRVRVRVFGSLREALGTRALDLQLADGTAAGALRAQLARAHPAVAAFGPRLRLSVNHAFAPDDAVLADGDEVALLPPVSGGAGTAAGGAGRAAGGAGGAGGGADAAGPGRSAGRGAAGVRCTLSETALVPAEVVARVAGTDAGGVVTFVGAVRDHARGRAIRYLEYEAYAELALPEMERICDEAGRRWPGTRVALAHRVGRLEVGEAAVIVAAVAPHRDAAFQACRFAIDTLKKTVPIWKKEVATDGAYWVDDHA
jgi:molybdopterin converting factor subunit 1